jgi:hypothetical protein
MLYDSQKEKYMLYDSQKEKYMLYDSQKKENVSSLLIVKHALSF